MDNGDNLRAKTRLSGQVIFILAGLALTLFLLSQITSQTAWSDRARTIAAQPRLWPAVGLGTMLAGLAGHYALMRRRRPHALDWAEARRWAEPIEFLGWFLVYVFAVPRLGFLPMSILLACALTYRLGYKTRAALGVAALFAIAMVLLFKGFLGVNIPGAALYEALPGGLRSFFLIYL